MEGMYMKILIPIAIYLLAALLLTLWSKNRHKYDADLDLYEDSEEKQEEDKEQDEEEEQEKVVDERDKKEQQMGEKEASLIAKKVDSELEAEYVMSQNSSKAVQVAMAETKNFEAQKHLLTSPDLCAEALVAICEKPANFNFENDTVERWFTNAINRTKLTPRQEIRISQNGKKFIMKRALILKDDLSAPGLIELCNNPGNMNLDSDTVRRWYLNAVNRIKPTEKQQLKMVASVNFAILRALLLSKELKAEALAAISESPGTMNTDNEMVWDWFEEAVKRTELTVNQQVRMAEAKNFASKRAILLNPNIVYEAFIALCKNTQSFNMENDRVHGYFKNATRRLLPTLSDQQKVELAQTKIEGVLMGLM